MAADAPTSNARRSLALRLLVCLLAAGCLAWTPVQQSEGPPNAGKLRNASRMPNNRYVKLRFPKNAWGTRRMVDLVVQCAKDVGRRHKRAHRLLVGDLSRRRGGTFRPHHGHQNGREADIGFYMRRGRPLDGLWKVRPHDIDARRTLSLLDCFARSGDSIRIFLDRRLQRTLVREAKRRRWSKRRIRRLFSYPERRRPGSLVWHASGHDNHIHLRIRCAKHEKRCKDQPVSRASARVWRRRLKRRPKAQGRREPEAAVIQAATIRR